MDITIRTAAATTGHIATTTGHMATTASHIATNTGHIATNTSQIAIMTAHMATITGHIANMTGHITTIITAHTVKPCQASLHIILVPETGRTVPPASHMPPLSGVIRTAESGALVVRVPAQEVALGVPPATGIRWPELILGVRPATGML
jgi:hypothetical protein